jgi:hypothetical protein
MNGGVSILLKNVGGGEFDPVWPDRSGLVVAGDATSLTVTDLNADGLPDFYVGINDGEQLAFQANRGGSSKTLCLQLRGGVGNPDAAGAQVTVVSADGRQMQQVAAGGGYLSQSSPRLFFGLGESGAAAVGRIEVRWPDDEVTSHALEDLERGADRRWISREEG